MKFINNTLLLRLPMAAILIMHSIPTIMAGTVNAFGTEYLDKVGFAPFGLVLAWTIKLSHVVAAVCLILDKYVKWAALATIVVLVAGIIMIHGENGWFVIGSGRNGIEFSVLMIFVLVYLSFPRLLSR